MFSPLCAYGRDTGEPKTRSFSLAGGNYVSEWTASDPTSGPPVGCFHSGFLESADPSKVRHVER